MSLGDRITQVNERIVRAAQRAGRNPNEITLVGVCKTVGRAAVEEAFQSGLRHFGENRVPDAEDKFTPLPYPAGGAKLHLIGHLQTNKARRAAALFDMIHSVDSVKLAQELNRHCGELGKCMPILLQFNVSGEATKQGFEAAEIGDVIEQLIPLPNIELRGLMTIAPYFENAEETRPIFARLRMLFENYKNNVKIPKWSDLSMGMTNDFEVAISEGATLVRVGRAIF